MWIAKLLIALIGILHVYILGWCFKKYADIK